MAQKPGWMALQEAGANAGWRNTFHDHFSAYLGNLEGTLETRDDPYPGGLICVRNSGGVSEEFTAYVHPSSGLVIDYRTPAGLSVQVGRWGDDPRWWVMGAVTSEGMTATSGRSLIQEFAQGVQYPVGANLMDFRVMPGVGLVVRVEQGTYYKPSTGGWQYWPGGEYDLTSMVGALTSGQHQMVVLGVDTEAGSLMVASATAETGNDKAQWSGRLGEVTIPARMLPGGAVWLYYGMNAIEESHIYRGVEEARWFMRTAGERVRVSTANVSSPPTDGELDSAFGNPGDVGKGFVAVVDDNGAGTAVYVVASDGTNWWYASMTKAV